MKGKCSGPNAYASGRRVVRQHGLSLNYGATLFIYGVNKIVAQSGLRIGPVKKENIGMIEIKDSFSFGVK
jgi:hypothetical protein